MNVHSCSSLSWSVFFFFFLTGLAVTLRFALLFHVPSALLCPFLEACFHSLLCCVLLERHLNKEEWGFLFVWLQDCFFTLLVRFYALYWKAVFYWLKERSWSLEKGNTGTRCLHTDQDLTRFRHTHFIKTDFYVEEGFKKKSLCVIPLVKSPQTLSSAVQPGAVRASCAALVKLLRSDWWLPRYWWIGALPSTAHT